MDIAILILKHFGLGVLGILVIVYAKYITSPGQSKFDWGIVKAENGKAVIGALVGIPLILVMFHFVPQASDILQTVAGLDINMETVDNGAAFSLGVGLYSIIRNASKK